MSTDTTAGILEAIDGALLDCGLSGDAMRWVPEETRTEENRPAADISFDDLALIGDAFFRQMAGFAEAFRRTAEAMKPVVQALVKAFSQMGHGLHLSLYPKQHQRCVTCHPWRKPKPLAVDGRAYQRRIRARRKRRR